MIWIDPEYRQLFPVKNLVAWLDERKGEVYRTGQGRKTLRFFHEGKNYFLKRHTGIGWKEILKDLFQFRLPILGASNEWHALQRLEILNVSSLKPVIFGEHGWNPAQLQSYIVTEELQDTISLEDLVLTWCRRPDFVSLKRKIIRQTARLARRMHIHGMNHRDMYICHIHVKNSWLDNPVDDPELFIIDLHRAQIRKSVPVRWVIKDVASLYFSSMEAYLTRRDYFRFILDYSEEPLRNELIHNRTFWSKVQNRADKLYDSRPRIDMVSE